MAFEWSPLLGSLSEQYQILNRAVVSDGRGGTNVVWNDGAMFDAVVEIQNSLEQETAMQAGVSGIYDVTVEKTNIALEYHTVFMRASDGAVFRVTSKAENTSPDISGMGIRKVRAEEYELEY